MGYFRQAPDRVAYGPWFVHVTTDEVEDGVFTAFIVLFVIQLLLLPLQRWSMATLARQIGIAYMIFVGYIIVISQFAHEFHTDETNVIAPFIMGEPHHLTADIGMHVGLRSVNITLKGTPLTQFNARVDYNERLSWSVQAGAIMPWHQGRLGFGQFSSPASQRYRAMQRTGVPKPILDVAEYFTLDGERLRWARWYRVAGFYTSIFLWVALVCWTLSFILFGIRRSLGALWVSITGLNMWFCAVLYRGLVKMAEPRLIIPVGDGALNPEFGSSYYRLLATGIVTNVLGALLYLAIKYHFWIEDKSITDKRPRHSSKFDVLSENEPTEKFYFTRLQTTRQSRLGKHLSQIPAGTAYHMASAENGENGDTVPPLSPMSPAYSDASKSPRTSVTSIIGNYHITPL